MVVIIAGGGIGGLTTALACYKAGIECRIFESVSELRELGVGVNLLPHAVRELTELDLLPQLKEIAVETSELCYFKLAFKAYDAVRRPKTSAIVLANRDNGPEQVMQMAEERAPDGFDDIHKVIDRSELEAVAHRYKLIAGFDIKTLGRQQAVNRCKLEQSFFQGEKTIR